MNKEQKAAVVDEIAGQLQEADAIFAVDYRGISVPQAAELRSRLRDADATFRVVKNRLTLRAAEQAGTEPLRELLEGPTALTFVRGDAAVAAKALNDVARTGGALEFKGGLLGDEPLTVEQIVSIARLPAREVLHGQLVGTIASPLTGLAGGLNALLAGVAVQLRQIADEGLIGGAAEEEAPAPADDAEAAAEEPAAAEGEAEAPAEPAEEAPAPEAEAEPPAEPDNAAPLEGGDEPDNQADASADDENAAEA
jgi:large subunit ribosomal protein L10